MCTWNKLVNLQNESPTLTGSNIPKTGEQMTYKLKSWSHKLHNLITLLIAVSLLNHFNFQLLSCGLSLTFQQNAVPTSGCKTYKLLCRKSLLFYGGFVGPAKQKVCWSGSDTQHIFSGANGTVHVSLQLKNGWFLFLRSVFNGGKNIGEFSSGIFFLWSSFSRKSTYGTTSNNNTTNLEDHPRTCKWFITMDSKSPKDRVIPIPNGLNGL